MELSSSCFLPYYMNGQRPYHFNTPPSSPAKPTIHIADSALPLYDQGNNELN